MDTRGTSIPYLGRLAAGQNHERRNISVRQKETKVELNCRPHKLGLRQDTDEGQAV